MYSEFILSFIKLLTLVPKSHIFTIYGVNVIYTLILIYAVIYPLIVPFYILL